MANVKVYLDPKKKKKNGLCSVFLTVNIDYKKLFFSTGVSVDPDKFDPASGKIKGTTKKVKDDNLIIESCLATMNDIFVRYRLQNIAMTAELLKNEWLNPSRRIDFYAFATEAVKEREKEMMKQTTKNHYTNIAKLKEWKPTMMFSEITPDLIDQYRRYLKVKKHNDINTVHTSLKIWKAHLNIAIKKGVIKKNPFDDVKLTTAAPDRVYLTRDELNLMWNAYKAKNLTDEKTKVLRHFLFMCYTGIRISDLKSMQKDEVRDGRLIFQAEKTKNIKKKYIKIPLNSYALQLIKDENSPTDKLFNTISEQKLNKYIKQIAINLGIDKPLSNHSGRHTFATLYLEMTNDLAGLQSLLGHSNIQDTMIYVHVTEANTAKQMSIFEKAMKPKPEKKEK
jgi:site-specific recombinase XerD